MTQTVNLTDGDDSFSYLSLAEPLEWATIHALAGNDTLTLWSGSISPGAGSDSLTVVPGGDILLVYNHDPGRTRGVVADLALGRIDDGLGGIDTVNRASELWGSAFDDTVLGSSATDLFEGYSGRDFFDGRGGFDVVRFIAGAPRDYAFDVDATSGQVRIHRIAGLNRAGEAFDEVTIRNVELIEFHDPAITSGDSRTLLLTRSLFPELANTAGYSYRRDVFPAFQDYLAGWAAPEPSAVSFSLHRLRLNGDHRPDYLLFLEGKNNAQVEANPQAPHPNRLVFLEAQPDGSFRDVTEARTGKAFFSVGGTVGGSGGFGAVEMRDLNADGIDDLVIASNRDDGRPFGTLDAQGQRVGTGYLTSLISGPGGLYQELRVVPELLLNAWGRFVDTPAGLQYWTPPHLLTATDAAAPVYTTPEGFEVGTAQRFAFDAAQGSWSAAGYAPVGHDGFRVLAPGAGNSERILSVIGRPTEGGGWGTIRGIEYLLGVLETEGQGFALRSWFSPFDYRPQPFRWADSPVFEASLVQAFGKDLVLTETYLDPTDFLPHPGATPLHLLRINALEAPWNAQQQLHLAPVDAAFYKLGFVTVSGDTVALAELPIVGEEHKKVFTWVEAMDVDGDGLQDLVASYQGLGAPRVYLNGGFGALHAVPASAFPAPPAEWYFTHYGRLADVNGDGHQDVMLVPGQEADPIAYGQNITDNQAYYRAEVFLSTGQDLAALIAEPVVVAQRSASPIVRTWAGNDTLHESGRRAGLTQVDLGAGLDTAVYAQPAAQYTVAREAGGALRVSVGGSGTGVGDGSADSLVNVERLRFADGALAFDLDANAGHAARLLATVFGQAALAMPSVAGVAIALVDQGMPRAEIGQLALSLVLGSQPAGAAVAALAWRNLVGSEIAPDAQAELAALIDGGVMSAGEFVSTVADLPVTAQLIGLAAMAQEGWLHLPVG